MKKAFYIPAMLFLILTLISGVWLRLQWGWPEWILIRVDYLIHGHSHVALLGWTFLGLAGFILEAGTYRRKLPYRMVIFLGYVVTLVTAILFVAFVYSGYAPLSIALSTLHMLLGYVIAWFFFRHARQDSNIAGQYFLEGAVFWMLLATAGTWLLAVGRGLPPFWMNTAVQFYLHLLFNGWFVFALAGMAFRYLIPLEKKNTIWPFWLMMAGLLPSLIPQLDLATDWGIFTYIGLAGTLIYGVGGLAVVWFVIRSFVIQSRRWLYKELLWTGLAGAVLVFSLPVSMALPPVREVWLQSEFLVIGFIHLHLLMTVSSLLLFAMVQRMATNGILYAKRSHLAEQYDIRFADIGMQTIRPISSIVRRTGSMLFVAGSVSMVAVLFATGIMQVAGIIPPLPVQKVLFYTGLVALTGVILLMAPVKR